MQKIPETIINNMIRIPIYIFFSTKSGYFKIPVVKTKNGRIVADIIRSFAD